MSTLADVFRVLAEMKRDGLIDEYAVGGAMAVLFYAEPTRTYDLDVFVQFKETPPSKLLVSLDSIYDWAGHQNFPVEAEHILIHGVPVQFLPAYNPLVEEAVAQARDLKYEGVSVRVVDPVHLVALAIQAGGARRRERALQLIGLQDLDQDLLRSTLAKHGLRFEIPDHG